MSEYEKAWNDANFGYWGGYKDGYFAGYRAALEKVRTQISRIETPPAPDPQPNPFPPELNPRATLQPKRAAP